MCTRRRYHPAASNRNHKNKTKQRKRTEHDFTNTITGTTHAVWWSQKQIKQNQRTGLHGWRWTQLQEQGEYYNLWFDHKYIPQTDGMNTHTHKHTHTRRWWVLTEKDEDDPSAAAAAAAEIKEGAAADEAAEANQKGI